MFGFGQQFHMHHHCMSNPFGATMANPKINFCLGMAAATSNIPLFSPMSTFAPMPMNSMMGSLFAAPMPMFGGFTGYNNFGMTSAFGGFNNLGSFGNFGNFGNFNFNFTQTSTPAYDFSNYFKNLGGNTSDVNITPESAFGNWSNFNFGTSFSSNNSKIENSNPAGKKLALNSEDYGPKFLEKVKQIAKRLNCNYRDLLGLMNSESGINSKAVNKNGGATGLIQFTPDTAKRLGTSTTALKNMSPLEQLDYVEKFLANAKSSAGLSQNDKLTAGDLYTLTFLPARAKREILTQSGENFYNYNSGLDLNKDGKITKAELGQRVKNKYVSDNSFLA